MARRASKHPTELELEILKVLWRTDSATVRDVREALSDFRELAHTSVMTVMGIMVDKGYLVRKRQGKSYVYAAAVSEKQTTDGMLGDLVDRVFEGSAMSAVLNLLETRDIDRAELDELQELIRRRAGEVER
jgi:predicted transcriptional regulator